MNAAATTKIEVVVGIALASDGISIMYNKRMGSESAIFRIKAVLEVLLSLAIERADQKLRRAAGIMAYDTILLIHCHVPRSVELSLLTTRIIKSSPANAPTTLATKETSPTYRSRIPFSTNSTTKIGILESAVSVRLNCFQNIFKSFHICESGSVSWDTLSSMISILGVER
jgi:hypothetical protein